MKKAIIIAVSTLPLMFLWRIFKDFKGKVDVYLFVDLLEKPKWVAHDVGWLLTNLLLTFALHISVQQNTNRYFGITLSLVIFATFRLLEYFLFRGKIPMLLPVGSVAIYALGTLLYKK